MSRLYHSASSIDMADEAREGCMRAWAWRYIAKIRAPEIAWADIESGRVRVLKRDQIVRDPKRECTPKQRSAALGKATHAVSEAWYDGGEPEWHGLPGQIFQSGMHLLPQPDACLASFPEEPIGDVALPISEADRAVGKPSVALEHDGIKFVGYKDLRVCLSHRERTRLGLGGLGAFDGGWLLVDLKTSKDVIAYAHSPRTLRDNVQACLYTVDCTRITGHAEQACRWVYFETAEIRRALPVDATIPRGHALQIVSHASALAKQLDLIERVEDAPANLAACEAFGGCQFHVSKGGPCKVRRRIGALVQLSSRKESREMTLTEAEKERMKADIAARRASLQATKPAAPAATKVAGPQPEVAVDETGEVVDKTTGTPIAASSAPAPKPARAPRKPAASAPAQAPIEPPKEADVTTVLALHAELADAKQGQDLANQAYDVAQAAAIEAQAAKDEADMKVAELVAKMREALG